MQENCRSEHVLTKPLLHGSERAKTNNIQSKLTQLPMAKNIGVRGI